jgi:hypothetical protein
MRETPADKIRALRDEYCERSHDAVSVKEEASGGLASPTKPGVGHIWFDSSTNQLWVCTGRINGELKWSKVPERLYE